MVDREVGDQSLDLLLHQVRCLCDVMHNSMQRMAIGISSLLSQNAESAGDRKLLLLEKSSQCPGAVGRHQLILRYAVTAQLSQ